MRDKVMRRQDEEEREERAMAVLDAIQVVLEQVGTPLNYRELTRRVLQGQLWHTTGKTPADTVCARLAVDITQRGSASRFQRTAKGMFALRAWGLPDYDGRTSRGRTGRHRQQQSAPSTAALPAVPAASAALAVSPSTAKALSFSDAAESVLAQYAGKKPMHYRALTERALELGLVKTARRTPEATLYAQILTENARRTRQGKSPRFVKQGRGYVGLASWQGQGLAGQIAQHNAQVRQHLHTRLKAMPPEVFEALIGQLLVALGFEDVEVTARAGDGGIDVRGTLVVGDVIRTRMAVQVKRWKHNVQAPIIQQVRGALGAHEQGLIITTSDFSSGARDEARRAGRDACGPHERRAARGAARRARHRRTPQHPRPD
jgi:restriction system protein